MKNTTYILLLLMSGLAACKLRATPETNSTPPPTVQDDGATLIFHDPETMGLFTAQVLTEGQISATLTAPAKVAATIVPSQMGDGKGIVLFDNPDLASHYAQLTQHLTNISQIQNINIRQRQLELERTQDLRDHGVATGQELLNAQTALSMERTNLANEKAALIEHEAQLLSAGFSADLLRSARAGTIYLMCDIPENQIGRIRKDAPCTIKFSSIPDQSFTGRIDGIADMVDNTTRMVKVRIFFSDPGNRLKAGMFALVDFNLMEGNSITLPQSALVTVQGKNYVFIKKNDSTLQRTAVDAAQQIGDRVVVNGGLSKGDEVVTQGVMQLKGLSFGY